MPLNMNAVKSAKPSVERKLLEAGPLPCRLVQVIDLGLQAQKPYQGQEKHPAYELYLTFEFPTETIEIDGEHRPMWKSTRIKLSSHEKSKCKKWYDKLDPSNQYGGDWSALLGTPLMCLIVHEAGKGNNAGRTFDKIADVMPLMKGLEVADLDNPTVVFNTDSPDMEIFNKFPEWIQNIIKENLEYDGSRLQASLEGLPTRWTARAEGDYVGDEDSASVSSEDTLTSTDESNEPY